MKKIVFMVLAAFVAVMPLFAVEPTRFPSGIGAGYENQMEMEAASTTWSGRPINKDSWIKGDLYIEGGVFTTKEERTDEGIFSTIQEFLDAPTADSDTLRTGATYGGVGGCVIATNTLVNGTSNYRDTYAFLSSSIPVNICTSFDIKFDSNYVTGTFDFTGVASDMVLRNETLSVLSGTFTWSNYCYYNIEQSTLTLTSHPYGRGEPSGSLLTYDNSAYVYPRYGIGTNIGLTNHPINNRIDYYTEDGVNKVPTTAVVVSSVPCIKFATAPNFIHDYTIGYRVRGTK